jgi:hypothetical protein
MKLISLAERKRKRQCLVHDGFPFAGEDFLAFFVLTFSERDVIWFVGFGEQYAVFSF